MSVWAETAAHISRIVAMMGHQPGHLFHPTKGAGHGPMAGGDPICRDLNFSGDPDAAGAVLAMNLKVTLIPCDAAKGTLTTGPDLDLLARCSRFQAWVAQTFCEWLLFWSTDMGLPGVSPFERVAAALWHSQYLCCQEVPLQGSGSAPKWYRLTA